VNKLAINGLLYGRSCGDESSADRVLFQFAAGGATRGLAGRALGGRIHGLRKETPYARNDVPDDREDGQQDEEAKKKPKHTYDTHSRGR